MLIITQVVQKQPPYLCVLTFNVRDENRVRDREGSSVGLWYFLFTFVDIVVSLRRPVMEEVCSTHPHLHLMGMGGTTSLNKPLLAEVDTAT